MITGLLLHNFKCFGDQRVEFRPLTLLVGANASGKSSVIQALLALRQSHRREALSEGKLLLNGRLASIGTVADVFYQRAQDRTLRLSLEVATAPQPVDFAFERGEPARRTLTGSPPPEGYTRLNLFEPRFNYLNAERIGPRPVFQMPEDDRDPYDVGIHGEYAVYIAGRDKQELIANEALAYEDSTTGETRREIYEQTRYWIRQIVPHFEYNIDPIIGSDQVQALFGNVPGQNLVRPSNIGFGLIYTLPIVVAALVALPGSLLIVENPEAHLHPRSQSIMGRFLARVAAAGVQVVVETHSDHILNGVRVAVRRGAWGQEIKADQVAIQYFIPADEQGPLRVETPRLYPSGGISPWPPGFFDQLDHDIEELL
ncbi:MAG: DUF3696 domain-containing protein [Chloroflexi bacterium OHK40]